MKIKYFIFVICLFLGNTVNSATIPGVYTGKISNIFIITDAASQVGEKVIAFIILEGGIGNDQCAKVLLPDGSIVQGFALPESNPALPANQSEILLAGALASKLNGTPITIRSQSIVNTYCNIDSIYF